MINIVDPIIKIGSGIIALLSVIIFIVSFIESTSFLYELTGSTKGIAIYSYVDAKNKIFVEERQYDLNWGWFFNIFKLFLQKISADTKFKLYCKPLISSKIPLPSDCYEVKNIDSYNKINLLKNSYFKKYEIEYISMLCERPINISEFNRNIDVQITQNHIIITNRNNIDIENYPLKLPSNISMSNIDKYFSVSSIIDMSQDNNNGITIYIRSLKAMKGNQPSVLSIPINS